MNERETDMGPESMIVLHGFLRLPNREKMKVVNVMNEYFDSTEKERLRAELDERFEALEVIQNGIECKCCGRK